MATKNRLVSEIETGIEKSKTELQSEVQHAVQTLSVDANRTSADLRRTLRANANTAKEKASDSLIATAETIRSEAIRSKNEEAIRQAQMIARGMEKAALYLDSRTLEQLGSDAEKTVRENVWPTVGIVLVVGFLLGLLLGGNRKK